jgi:hypothetical protein
MAMDWEGRIQLLFWGLRLTPGVIKPPTQLSTGSNFLGVKSKLYYKAYHSDPANNECKNEWELYLHNL